MATIIDALLVTLGLDGKAFSEGAKAGETQLEHLRKTAEDVTKEIKSRGAEAGEYFLKFAERAAAVIGIGLSLHELKSAIQETAAEYVDLAKLAEQFHTTAEAVDEFADTGKLLGLSKDITIGGLKELDRAVQDTALGLGRAKKVFESMNISVTDAAGAVKPTTAVMAELAEKFKDMERGKQIRVMERLGLNPALLKLFNADIGEMQKRLERVDDATGFNLNKAVKNSQAFIKATKGMQLEINSLKLFFDKLFEAAYVNAMPALTEMLVTAKKYIGEVFDYIVDHKDVVVGVMIAMGAAVTYYLLPPLLATAAAAIATIAPFLGIAAVVASVVAVFALLYDDWAVWIDGGTSSLGAFWQFFADVWGKIEGTVTRVMSELKGVFTGVFSVLIDVVKLFVALFFGSANDVKKTWSSLCGDIPALWGNVWKLVFDVIDAAAIALQAVTLGLWENIKAGAGAFADWMQGRLGLMGTYFDDILPGAMRAFRGVRDVVFSDLALIGDMFKAVVSLMTGDITGFSQSVSDIWTDIKTGCIAAFSIIGIDITGVFSWINSAIETTSRIVESIAGVFSKTGTSISTAWGALWDGLKSVAAGVVDWLMGKLDAVAGMFSRIGKVISLVKGPNSDEPQSKSGDAVSHSKSSGATVQPAPVDAQYDDLVSQSMRPSAAAATAALDAARPAQAATAISPSVSNNSESKTTITKETHIGEINIHTQATDANGVAAEIGNAVQSNAMADQADAGM